MSSPEARQRLAAEQAALVQALLAHQPAPPGFDVVHLEAAATALAQKRCRGVAKAWPTLTSLLGEQFTPHFTAFAAVHPLPTLGGPLADGRAFARYLTSLGKLPEETRLELLIVDLHYASTKGGLVPRRGLVLRGAWLRRSRRLLLGLRIPWLGVRWWAIALGRS